MSLYNYTRSKNEDFAAIASEIPRNTSYTSCQIQNELIESPTEAVWHDVKEIITSNVPFYIPIISVDGTLVRTTFGIWYTNEAKTFNKISWFEETGERDAQNNYRK